MKRFISAVVLLFCTVLSAENILSSLPAGGEYGIWSKWIADRKIPVQFSVDGGADNASFIKTDLNNHRLAVENLKLEAGKTYRIGAFVRTSGIRQGKALLIVHNHKWKKDVRSGLLPANTDGRWVRVEFRAVLPESSNGLYTFTLYGAKLNPEASIEISSPYIKIVEIPKKQKAPGGNLIPGFDASANGEFGLWSDNVGRFNVKLEKFPGAGVDKADFLRVTGGIRLGELYLVAGEKYRVSAYVRTRGGIAPDSRLIIYNSGWVNDVLVGNIPTDTGGKWQKIENEVVIPACRYGIYNLAFYLPSGGTIDICKVSLEGVSPRAIDETFPVESYLPKMRRIYPVTPLLTLVDAANPQITFSYSCPLPGKNDDYFCRMRLAGSDGKFLEWHEFAIPENRWIRTSGPAMPPGNGRLQVEIVRKNDRQTVLSNAYDVKFVAPLPDFRSKRLNNIVVELLNTGLADGKYRFVNPRDGWVYLGFENSSQDAAAVLNEKPVVHYRPGSDKLETMRYLPRGEQSLTVTNTGGKGRLIVRTVPEIMLFPLEVWEKPGVENFQYDLAFFRKYFWPNINTHFLIRSWMPKNEWERSIGAEVDERGIRRIGSAGFGSCWRDVDKMRANFLSNGPTITTEGRACDETEATADPIVLHTYSETCWEFTDWNKFIYLWMARSTCFLHYPLYHGPLFAGAAHIGGGHGKLNMETYVETTPDLESLKEYYQLVPNHLIHAKRSTPDAPQRMMLVMSGLIANGAWNCNAYPQSDIKYAWDYFFYLVATHPEVRDLYGIGCYNIRYTDEENARWLARLFRHYAIEGNTQMLSPQYGIVYNTGAVTNGDFKAGLEGWEVFPAEEGSIVPRTIEGYGFKQLKRRGRDRFNGDTVVQLTCSDKAPNKLSQTLKNLTPGKLYSFFYVSTDGDKQEKNEAGRVDFALEADLEGAEILPHLSYEFRNPPEYLKIKRLEVVTRKIVFRAKAPEVKVTLRDWKDDRTPGGPKGSRRLVNFVGVSVYYAE